MRGRRRGSVLDQAAYRLDIPVAPAFHSLQSEGSTRGERDHYAAAFILSRDVVVVIADVESGLVVPAARESREEIREPQLIVAQNPDRDSRVIRMEDVDLAVEVQGDRENVGIFRHFDSRGDIVGRNRSALGVDADYRSALPRVVLRRGR
jgi:hypothetical protein